MQPFGHIFTFLDVNVSILNGEVATGLCTKPTDKHQYLLQSIQFSSQTTLHLFHWRDVYYTTHDLSA